MILTLEKVGVPVEVHHHEVGTAGQAEIDMRFGPLTKLADSLMYYKYIIRNVVAKYMVKSSPSCPSRFSVTMARVCTATRVSGRARQTCSGTRRVTGKSARRPATTSGACSSTLLPCWPCGARTTNSYRRLVPGYDSPVNLVYSRHRKDRLVAVRIPI